MEFRLLKAEIVPRLHAMCLKTTSAGVRFNSMVALSKIVTRLDQDECDKIVQTVTKVRQLLHACPKSTLFEHASGLCLPWRHSMGEGGL